MSRSLPLLGLLAALLAASGCGGSESASQVVSPAGAPYAYTVPEGFEASSPTVPPGQKFLTTAVPAGSTREGYLGVYEWPLGKSERGYSTARLLSWLDRQTLAFYHREGATVSPGTRRRVAGHGAVCWRIKHFRNPYEGPVDATSCAIVSAHRVVEQSCVWKPATRATILSGCRELVASLQIS